MRLDQLEEYIDKDLLDHFWRIAGKARELKIELLDLLDLHVKKRKLKLKMFCKK